MEKLTITRKSDGVDYLWETKMIAYKWTPTNDELKDQYAVRQLFNTKEEAIAYDEEARKFLLEMIQWDWLDFE